MLYASHAPQSLSDNYYLLYSTTISIYKQIPAMCMDWDNYYNKYYNILHHWQHNIITSHYWTFTTWNVGEVDMKIMNICENSPEVCVIDFSCIFHDSWSHEILMKIYPISQSRISWYFKVMKYSWNFFFMKSSAEFHIIGCLYNNSWQYTYLIMWIKHMAKIFLNFNIDIDDNPT